MTRHFDQDLRSIEERFQSMGVLAQKAIRCSNDALLTLDRNAAMEVIDNIEPEIDRFQSEIDRLGLDLLALQQPLASDLRLITAIMKSTNDLERMGDKALNIAMRVISIISNAAAKPMIEISQMGIAAEAMVHDALDAFHRKDEQLAREVLKRDDEVDRYRDIAIRDLIAEMTANPQLIQQGLDLILASRNFERIADHATNIAEGVIFLVHGKDIRHQAESMGA